jgi:hypothetical protein
VFAKRAFFFPFQNLGRRVFLLLFAAFSDDWVQKTTYRLPNHYCLMPIIISLFLSHIKSALATCQPTVFFYYNKSASATSQPNKMLVFQIPVPT